MDEEKKYLLEVIQLYLKREIFSIGRAEKELEDFELINSSHCIALK